MKSNVACTTETLAGLNERIKEALTCIYMLSNAVILVSISFFHLRSVKRQFNLPASSRFPYFTVTPLNAHGLCF